MLVAYEELDDKGEPIKDRWKSWPAGRTPCRTETYFSQIYSKKEHEKGTGELEADDPRNGQDHFDGKYLYYEFNSEGICSKRPGPSYQRVSS